MKITKFIFSIVLILFGVTAYCQHPTEPQGVDTINTEQKDEIFTIVETNPEFQGGNSELHKFLHTQINYPQEASDHNIEGTVYLSVTVEKDGTLTGPKILRGIGYGCDEEAIRLINLMPKWSPGKQRGIPVRVQINLPVLFAR